MLEVNNKIAPNSHRERFDGTTLTYLLTSMLKRHCFFAEGLERRGVSHIVLDVERNAMNFQLT